MQSALALIIFLGLVGAQPARAQKASENVVERADDAFGSTVGSEAIGLYDATEVRGFSPSAAGNIRIDDLYADLQSGPSERLSDNSVVRVGSNTEGELLPGPSGLVDYALRAPTDQDALGTRVSVDSWDLWRLEADGALNSKLAAVSVNFGAEVAGGNDYRGTQPRDWSIGIIPRWRPSASFDLALIYEHAGQERRVEPFYYTAGAALPPRVARGRFLGQTWSEYRTNDDNLGMILNANQHGWSLKAGLFDSFHDVATDTFDLIEDVRPDRTGLRTVYRFPRQTYGSLSGEARIARSWISPTMHNTVTFAVRGRVVDSRYGGEIAIPLGEISIDAPSTAPAPTLRFMAPQTRDSTRQLTVGLGYKFEWSKHLDLDVSAGRADYVKTVATPPDPEFTAGSRPWLYSALVGWRPSERTLLYVSTARGLEGSGVAPTNAVNRNAVLPAILTDQEELGLRASVLGLSLSTALFAITKPYAGLHPDGLYSLTGTVRHRGVEASLAGALDPGLDIVLGAVAIDGRVTGSLVDVGTLSKRPIAVPDYRAQAAMTFRPGNQGPWSFDAVASLTGAQNAKLDGSLRLPMFATVDLGFRYRYTVDTTPIEVRAQMLNAGNTYAFTAASDEAFFYIPSRSARLTVSADF